MKAADLSPKSRKAAEAIATRNGLTVAEVLHYIATISRPQSNAKMKRIFFAGGVSKHSHTSAAHLPRTSTRRRAGKGEV